MRRIKESASVRQARTQKTESVPISENTKRLMESISVNKITNSEIRKNVEHVISNIMNGKARLLEDSPFSTSNLTSVDGMNPDPNTPAFGWRRNQLLLSRRVFVGLGANMLCGVQPIDEPFGLAIARRRIYNHLLFNGVYLADVLQGRVATNIISQDHQDAIKIAYQQGKFEAGWDSLDDFMGYTGGYKKMFNTQSNGSLDPNNPLNVTFQKNEVGALGTQGMNSTTIAFGESAGTILAATANLQKPISLDPMGTTSVADVAAVLEEVVEAAKSNGMLNIPGDLQESVNNVISGADGVTNRTAGAVLADTIRHFTKQVVGFGANPEYTEAWRIRNQGLVARVEEGSSLEGTTRPLQNMFGINDATGGHRPGYRPDGATGLYYPENERMPELITMYDKKNIDIKDRVLAASMSDQLLAFVRAYQRFDEKAELTQDITYEILAEKNREILQYAKGTATNLYVGGGSEAVVDLNRYSNLSSSTTSAIPGGVNVNGASLLEVNTVENRNQYVINSFLKAASVVGKKVKRDFANHAVVSMSVAAALQMARGFERETITIDTAYSLTGAELRQVGTINGRIKIFVDPLANDDYALVYYKGEDPRDAGMIYSPFIESMITEGKDGQTLQTRVAARSIYGITTNLLSAGNYYRLLRFNNLSSLHGITLGEFEGW